MRVTAPNDIKIYHLSCGRSIPEWLSERERRRLLKKNVGARRRIELIQNFDMPDLSTSIKVSKDGQYIFATGTYKPRVKCFDVNDLSLKFERCFDSEVVTFEILTDDYSKVVFLQNDRYIEFHSSAGKHCRIRVPKYGRDLKYHYPSCDLFIVGTGNEIYRLNLLRGQFLSSFVTEASSINKCEINPFHHLLVVGTEDGKIEAWDQRVKNRVGTLDCALHCIMQKELEGVPAITALKFQGDFNLGVGTSTGEVLLYDIRSSMPFFTKDHMYGLPIKCIDFHPTMNLVYSMDSSILKIWEKDNGKLYTFIQTQHDFNDLYVLPNTGMLLMANEDIKMQTYYIPSLGPAPFWCNFLDNLIEELEEVNADLIYDDYKFVTVQDLNELGLTHLIGTKALRAYMHGYFIDIGLYRKVKNLIKPFDFEVYKKDKIREKIKGEAPSRLKIQKLPTVNEDLALKCMEDLNNKNKKKQAIPQMIMKNERFKSLFANVDFQIDKNSEEYTLLNPVIAELDKNKAKKLKQKLAQEAEKEEEEEEEMLNENEQGNSSDESFVHDSSDDEKPWAKEVKKNYRLIKKNERDREQESGDDDEEDNDLVVKNKLHENDIKFKADQSINNNIKFKAGGLVEKKNIKTTLGKRLNKIENDTHNIEMSNFHGNREITFNVKKKDRHTKANRHRTEYNVLRPMKNIFKKRY